MELLTIELPSTDMTVSTIAETPSEHSHAQVIISFQKEKF